MYKTHQITIAILWAICNATLVSACSNQEAGQSPASTESTDPTRNKNERPAANPPIPLTEENQAGTASAGQVLQKEENNQEPAGSSNRSQQGISPTDSAAIDQAGTVDLSQLPQEGKNNQGKAEASNGSQQEGLSTVSAASYQAGTADASQPKQEEDKQEKARKNQQNIKREIITTEASHNTSLHFFKDQFLTPLQAAFQSDTEVKKFIDDLLATLTPLITISDQLIESLEAKNNQGKITNEDVGEIFQNLSFKPFEQYIPAYYETTACFMKLSKENEKFKSFLTQLENENNAKSTNKLDFSSYTIMPVQRLPRYKLLLEDLVKKIPSEDASYQVIQEALQKIKAILQVVNSQTPKMNAPEQPTNNDQATKVPLAQATTTPKLMRQVSQGLINASKKIKKCSKATQEQMTGSFKSLSQFFNLGLGQNNQEQDNQEQE